MDYRSYLQIALSIFCFVVPSDGISAESCDSFIVKAGSADMSGVYTKAGKSNGRDFFRNAKGAKLYYCASAFGCWPSHSYEWLDGDGWAIERPPQSAIEEEWVYQCYGIRTEKQIWELDGSAECKADAKDDCWQHDLCGSLPFLFVGSTCTTTTSTSTSTSTTTTTSTSTTSSSTSTSTTTKTTTSTSTTSSSTSTSTTTKTTTSTIATSTSTSTSRSTTSTTRKITTSTRTTSTSTSTPIRTFSTSTRTTTLSTSTTTMRTTRLASTSTTSTTETTTTSSTSTTSTSTSTSTSTTTTTTTTTTSAQPVHVANPVEIEGNLMLTVSGVQRFLGDPVAQDILKDGIAQAYNVSAGAVVLSMPSGRRLKSYTRKLSENCTIAYKIIVSSMSDNIQTIFRATTLTTAALNSAIQARFADKRVATYGVAVVSKGQVLVKQVTIMTTPLVAVTNMPTTIASRLRQPMQTKNFSTSVQSNIMIGAAMVGSLAAIPIVCGIALLCMRRYRRSRSAGKRINMKENDKRTMNLVIRNTQLENHMALNYFEHSEGLGEESLPLVRAEEKENREQFLNVRAGEKETGDRFLNKLVRTDTMSSQNSSVFMPGRIRADVISVFPPRKPTA